MEKKKTGISYVFQLAKDERKKLHLGMFLSVISATLSLVPYFVVYKILLMIFQKNILYTEILMWAGIGIISAVLQAILMSFAGILSHTAAFNTIHRIKLKVVNHISKFNLGFFQEHAPGEIKTLLFDDVDRVENFLAHSTLELAQAAVVPVIMFIFMLKLNWMMALVMLIPMILGLGIPMMLMKNYPDMSTELSEDIADLNASANEFIKAMPVIKMYHLTAEKFEQYRSSLNAYITCWKKMCMSSCYPLSITLVVLDSAILFTLPFGGYFFLRNSLSATSYLLFIMLTMCFFVSFLNMVTIFMQSMELGSGLDNIKKIMDMDELKDGTKIINKNECMKIDFKDVTFSYDDEETKNKALQHINLSLKPNTINAFVGPSGAGKTTAAQLIGRYWDVTSGAIKINDIPINELKIDNLMDITSFVFQDVFLLEDTLYENIRMGTDADENKIIEAAKAAQIHDFIMSLPNGYQTRIGDQGVKLSGGQQQRISIARAILKDSPIIIFDEATSYSDIENEYQIQLALQNLLKNKTIIMIAHRLHIFLMVIDSIGSIVLYLMLYFTVVNILQNTLTKTLIIEYTVICFISMIARILIYRHAYYLSFSRGAELCGDMRLDLANHYRSLSLGHFQKNSSGYLLSTLTKDLSSFELILTHTLPSVIKTAVTAILILLGTFFIDWKLALLECLVLLIAYPMLIWGNKLIEKYGARKRNLNSKMISIILEYIQGMKAFKSANMTSEHFERMINTLENVRKTSVNAEKKMALPTSMYFITVNFLLPIVLLIGGYLLINGSVRTEQFVAFMLMSLALSALLIAFQHSYGLLKDLKLAASNLEKAYETKPLPYSENEVELENFDIQFKNVNFSYDRNKTILNNISFEAKEGTSTALIGPSGGGKTTIANLIARFWDVNSGEIIIGGKNIKSIKPDVLLKYVSQVFQDNVLLTDTVYNNIRVGKPNATKEEVYQAAKLACCHEFILKMKDGYETEIKDGGSTLSGGERQRIAIARAILKDAPILLLDESTASLDPDNEAKINNALEHLMQGKTVFVIAHRLNTIKNANQIILINNGRIEEQGNHNELYGKKGHYYEMVNTQERAKKWIIKENSYGEA